MIIFLNFAPFEYQGGVEKWIVETAKNLQIPEQRILISVSPRISNYYARFILKRRFDKRAILKETPQVHFLTLDLVHFIPFTKSWCLARDTFNDSKLIYTKYELLEMLIIFYLGGYKCFRKIVVGLHSPFKYSVPLTFFDRLHNLLYLSRFSGFILRKVKLVHVFTKRDNEILSLKFNLSNIVLLPIATEGLTHHSVNSSYSNDKVLNIIFAGELNLRKGVDMLIEIIKKSQSNFMFHIVGDGPYKNEVFALSMKYENCIYHGYLKPVQLAKVFSNMDVLLLPSRAESVGFVMIEAMSHGLPIINTKAVSLEAPSYIETSINNRYLESFIRTLKTSYSKKKHHKIDKFKISNYASTHYSFDRLTLDFESKILNSNS